MGGWVGQAWRDMMRGGPFWWQLLDQPATSPRTGPPPCPALPCPSLPCPLQILDLRRQRLLGASGAGDAPAFRQFLNTCVPILCRASNNLLDIQVRGGAVRGAGGRDCGSG